MDRSVKKTKAIMTALSVTARELLDLSAQFEPTVPTLKKNKIQALELLGALKALTLASLPPSAPPATAPQPSQAQPGASEAKREYAPALRGNQSLVQALLELKRSRLSAAVASTRSVFSGAQIPQLEAKPKTTPLSPSRNGLNRAILRPSEA